MNDGGRSREIGPPEEERHLDDGQKALLLGTYLLAAALSWDSERGIYEAEEGDLIAVLPVEDRFLELAREAFMREGNKALGDPNTELFIAWTETGDGHTLVSWHIQNPTNLSLVDQLGIPMIEKEEDEQRRSDEG
jgi:hypothetical protein